MEFIILGVVIFICILLGSIKQINEYEKGIKFTRGKYSKTLNSGWHVIWPIFQSLKKIDIRTKVIGTNNPRNVVYATINGLSNMKTVEQIAEKRGKKVSDII